MVRFPAQYMPTKWASWVLLSFGGLPRSLAFGFGDFHAFPRSHPDEIGSEFGDHSWDVGQ